LKLTRDGELSPEIGSNDGGARSLCGILRIDQDLVAAVDEHSTGVTAARLSSPDAVVEFIAELPDREKTGLLTCVTDSNPHVTNARPATIRTRRPGYKCETATRINGEITWNAFNYPGLPVDSGRC
jgi:hypothetical protein